MSEVDPSGVESNETRPWPRLKRHTPGRWTFLAAMTIVVLIAALALAVTVAIFAT